MTAARTDAETAHLMAMSIWLKLADAEIVTSVCFGPRQGEGNMWTVQCYKADTREEFENPYAANDFLHALMVAETESRDRGWI